MEWVSEDVSKIVGLGNAIGNKKFGDGGGCEVLLGAGNRTWRLWD